MRGLRRQKQDVWICSFTEINIGMARARLYDKPMKCRLSVSATSGYVFGWGAGLNLSYDRYMTCFDDELRDLITEGQCVFIDRVPELEKDGELSVDIKYETDEDGNIIYDEDGEPTIIRLTYNTEPDYIIDKKYDTQRGEVARYGIKKL